jgi:hypothetical protein
VVQGQGKYQLERRLKTESKVVAFLNLQQFSFNELQSISGIRRNSLRSTLDSLVSRKIIIKHIIKTPTDKKIRRGIYYSLNSNNKEAKRLLDMYYSDRPILPSKEEKETLDMLQKYLSDQVKIVGEQDDFFKKQAEPKLLTHEPSYSFYIWTYARPLAREYIKQLNKITKISAIKARLRLPDRRKS